jgi:hypothetical protein
MASMVSTGAILSAMASGALLARHTRSTTCHTTGKMWEGEAEGRKGGEENGQV